MRRIAVLDAPSNLGLRPPTATSVPGCAKAPGALRDHGLLTRLGARDAGCLTPPRYDPGEWRPGDGVAHAAQIAAYSRALADRIGAILDAGEFPVVLGGDCSILLGSGLAMHRLGEAVGGRVGLVFVDGHSDFRHPGNASYVGAAAGEDLALVTGRGQSNLAAIEGRRPYFRDIDVVVLGIRAQDEYRLDLQAAGIVTRPVPALRAEGAARSAQWARDQLVDCAGYWLHVDVDVLDPAVMPAVDAPSPGGIAFPELELLLAGLVESPHCLGVEITVYDPDYDPDGEYAAEITSAVTAGLAAARTVAPRPDLVAARADLAKPSRIPAPGTHPTRPRTPAESEELPTVPARSSRLARPADSERPSAPAQPSRLAPRGESEGPPAPAQPSRLAPRGESEGPPAPAQPSRLAPRGESEGRTAPAQPSRLGQRGESEPPGAPAQPSRLARPAPPDRATAPAQLNRSITPAEPDRPAAPAEPEQHAAPTESAAGDAEPSPAGPPSEETAPDAPAVAPTPAAEPAAELTEPAVEPAASSEPATDSSEAPDRPAEAVDLPAEAPEQPADVPAQAAALPRPLGQAPMLDSDPLPATRPGMLRPRANGYRQVEPDSFTLPIQRPAFEAGSDEPADIA